MARYYAGDAATRQTSVKKLHAAPEHTMSFIRTLAGGLLGCALPLAAMPATAGAPVGIDAGPAIIGSAGVFALVEAYDYPYLVGLQYRGRALTEWSLKPGIGLSAGADGMSFLYVDLARDFALPRRWFLTLSVAGGWFVGGEEIGTGHHTQFQSGIEISRRLAGGARLGLGGYHISNAGLTDGNNGTEAIALTVTLPVRRSRGKVPRAQSPAPSSTEVDSWSASPAAANRSSSSRRMSSPASAR
jgi:lipid A 3-O-deacylase